MKFVKTTKILKHNSVFFSYVLLLFTYDAKVNLEGSWKY